MGLLVWIGVGVLAVAAAASFRRRGRHAQVGRLGRLRDRMFLLGAWDAGGRFAPSRRRYRYSERSTRGDSCGSGDGGGCGSGGGGGCGGGGGGGCGGGGGG